MRVCIGGPRDGERTEGVPDGYTVFGTDFLQSHKLLAREVYARLAEGYRVPMSEDEILKRARAAASAEAIHNGFHDCDYSTGEYDTAPVMCAVVRALRDLDKPPVDPVTERLDALMPPTGTTADWREVVRKAYEMGRTDGAI